MYTNRTNSYLILDHVAPVVSEFEDKLKHVDVNIESVVINELHEVVHGNERPCSPCAITRNEKIVAC